MEYKVKPSITKEEQELLKEFSELVEKHILSAFPSIPKDVFSSAKYSINARGYVSSITVYSNRYATSFIIRLSDDLCEPSVLVTAGNHSPINMPTKRLKGIVKKLSSKGFSHKIFNSNVKFTGLEFESSATYFINYFQAERVLPNKEVEYYIVKEEFN